MKKFLVRIFAPIAVGLVALTAVFTLMSQKLGCGGAGLGGSGNNVSVDVAPPNKTPAASAAARPPEPLEITIDDKNYFVEGTEVATVDELVKRAGAVPSSVRPPRVRIVRLKTARVVEIQQLEDALNAAGIEFSQP